MSEEEGNSGQDETLSLLTRKFSRFMKKKSRERTQPKKRYSKLNESNSSNYTCFGCDKSDHIKVDCPNNQNKDKQANKKVERSRGKRAYISWEDNEVSSSGDPSTETEETNLCFLVNNEESSYDSISNYSTDSESYDQLLITFKETHDEANNQLEPKVKSLEKELFEAKTKLVNLELTCIHVSIKTCENCKGLQKEIKYMLKTLSNFTKGRENLETLLGSQNVVFNRNGIGYNSGRKNNVKMLSSFFVPTKTGFSSFNSFKSKYFMSCVLLYEIRSHI